MQTFLHIIDIKLMLKISIFNIFDKNQLIFSIKNHIKHWKNAKKRNLRIILMNRTKKLAMK